ncbi:MAG: hypothetical protein IMZ61_01480, partial [Planctomycetes bacterium]|nr:hypothetical protein [Planctomycetota bacterium]
MNTYGISTCGDASINGVPIAGYIESFIDQRLSQTKIEVNEIPALLLEYFRGFTTVPDTEFLVGGYLTDNGTRIQQVWDVHIKTESVSQIVQSQGAIWRGETDIFTR